MIDRQKVETILRRRFRFANVSKIAAAEQGVRLFPRVRWPLSAEGEHGDSAMADGLTMTTPFVTVQIASDVALCRSSMCRGTD